MYKRNSPLSGYHIKRGDKIRLKGDYEYQATRRTYETIKKGTIGHVVRVSPPTSEIWFKVNAIDLEVDINDLQVFINGKWVQATWDLNDNPKTERDERFGYKVSSPVHGEIGSIFYLMEYNLDDESDWTIIDSFSTRIAAEHAKNIKEQNMNRWG